MPPAVGRIAPAALAAAVAAIAILAPLLLVALVPVAAALTLLAAIRWPGAAIGWARVVWPLGLLVVWALITALWAVEADRATERGLRLAIEALGGVGLLALVAQVGAETRHRAIWGVAVGAALGCTIAIVDILAGGAVTGWVRGSAATGNWLTHAYSRGAAISALLLPALIAWAALVERGRSWALAAAAVVLALSLLAGSWTVVVALCLAAVAAVLAWRGRWVRNVVIAAAALFLLASPVLVGELLSVKAVCSNLASIEPSLRHRLLIWDWTGARIAERPIAGWGFDNARVVPGADDEAAPETCALAGDWYLPGTLPNLPLHPHNGGLQIWLELGGIGAVLFAAMFLKLLRAGFRLSGPGVGASLVAAVAAGYGTVAAASFGLWQGWWVGAQILILAFVAAVLRAQAPPDP